MVEPLFRFEGKIAPEVGSSVSLTEAEAKHAIAARRMRVGEAIQLSNGFGMRVRGRVSAIDQGILSVQVESVSQQPEPELKFTLIQALAKGDRDELAVQAATEIGIWQVIPWQAERSISRWEGPKQQKGVARWQSIANEATKQSLQVFEPQVLPPQDSKGLTSLFSNFDLVLILDPEADRQIGSLNLDQTASIALIIGPEGGISEAEISRFTEAGALRVKLGSGILRTSTAGLVALSVLQTRVGMFGN